MISGAIILDKHTNKNWYVRAAGIASMFFEMANNGGAITRLRLIDIAEGLEQFAQRIRQEADKEA